MKEYQSWGKYPKVHQTAQTLDWRNQDLPRLGRTILPFGQGHSYGDCCLNDQGVLLDTIRLDHFLSFNSSQGFLQCEAGATIGDVLQLILPHGWMLPVVPGTQFVSIGGAIANDVHGKNQHQVGSFGCHVRQFELLRSDGTRLLCSPTHNSEWFFATIGGLGLTGLILWAELQLKQINGPFIKAQCVPFSDIRDCIALFEASDGNWEYSAAWLDGTGRNWTSGKGVLFQGNHCDPPHQGGKPASTLPEKQISIPMDLPSCILNKTSIWLFNVLYHVKQSLRRNQVIHLREFLFPLDAIKNWNRLYGKPGFLQYQCVVPIKEAAQVLHDMFHHISRSKKNPYLVILKHFGDKSSGGILSFPREGVTLAIDFPNEGESTICLLGELDQIVEKAHGAVYPAKDACMSSKSFQAYFPQWKTFYPFVDQNFSSNFWRRVTEQDGRTDE